MLCSNYHPLLKYFAYVTIMFWPSYVKKCKIENLHNPRISSHQTRNFNFYKRERLPMKIQGHLREEVILSKMQPISTKRIFARKLVLFKKL